MEKWLERIHPDKKSDELQKAFYTKRWFLTMKILSKGCHIYDQQTVYDWNLRLTRPINVYRNCIYYVHITYVVYFMKIWRM